MKKTIALLLALVMSLSLAACGGGSGMPCGACREFFMQLSPRNKDAEILVNYETRETITLNELMPKWWGDERYAEQMSNGESET